MSNRPRRRSVFGRRMAAQSAAATTKFVARVRILTFSSEMTDYAASPKQEPFARWPMRGRYRDRCDDSGRCAKGFARSRCVASGAYGHLGRQPGPRRAFPEAQAEHVALRQFTDDVDGRCWLSSATAQMRCQRRLSGLVVMRRQCSAIAGAFGGSGSGRRISGVIVIMRCRRRRDPGSAHQ
jgi:hypothetical protein